VNLATHQANLLALLLPGQRELSDFPHATAPGGAAIGLGVQIYRNNVFHAHLNALREIYPILLNIVGEHYFSQLARDYLHRHPSNSPDLNHYGGRFPAYLTQLHNECSELEGLPYCGDLCRLEWLWHRAYFADQSLPFDYQKLQTITEGEMPDIQFVLASHVGLIRSRWPILAIWEANKNRLETGAVTATEEEDLLMIDRRDYKPTIHRLSSSQWQLLQQIDSRTTLATILASPPPDRIEYPAENQPDIQGLLAIAIDNGWVSGFRLPK